MGVATAWDPKDPRSSYVSLYYQKLSVTIRGDLYIFEIRENYYILYILFEILREVRFMRINN